MTLPLRLLLLFTLALAWAVPASAQVEPEPSRSAWRVAPVEEGVVLLPLVPASGTDDPLRESKRAWAPLMPEVEGGDARLRRLVARAPGDEMGLEGASWFDAPLVWTEAPEGEPALTASVWLLEVEVGDARTLRVGRRDVELFETPPPHRSRVRAPGSEVFRRALERVDADPFERWRAGWLGGARAGALGDEPLVVRWADAIGARWDEAIGRLSAVDAMTSRLVEHRLVAIADPFGEPLPVWTLDRPSELTLLRELLTNEGDALVSAASAWLERTAPAIAWVVDDAPLVREGQLASADVGLVSLSALPVTASLTTLRGPARLTPALEAGPVASVVRLPVNPELASDVVIARSGAWERRVGVVSAALEVAPPGLSTGDFRFDQTRATFGTDRAPRGGADRTRALVTRLEPGVWQVVVECEGSDEGEVTLWLGPRGRGESASIARNGTGRAGLVRTWSVVEEERWIAGFVFEQRDHEDPDGLLRLAVVREDKKGARSAWPRPMVPGQQEPGRIALDPSLWASPDE